jgi:hypothetical protein
VSSILPISTKEQPPLIIEHKKTKTFDVGNHGSGFGKAQQCGGVVIGSPMTIPSENHVFRRVMYF